MIADNKQQIHSMSDDQNNTAEQNTESQTVEQVPDTILDIRVGTEVLPVRETIPTKGRGKGKVKYFIEIDLSKPDPFAAVKRAVGEANWNKTVFQMLKAACNDATQDAMKDGEVSDEDWAKELVNQFIGDRRTGTGVKQLRERQAALFGEIQPFMMRQAHGEKLSPDENTRMLTLLTEFSEINEKIEKKSRKGAKTESTAKK